MNPLRPLGLFSAGPPGHIQGVWVDTEEWPYACNTWVYGSSFIHGQIEENKNGTHHIFPSSERSEMPENEVFISESIEKFS